MASKGKKRSDPAEKSAQNEFIRRFKSNPFVFIGTVVILIIVIVAFVLVPAIVPNAEGANIDLTFGYYDKTPITYVRGNYLAQVQSSYAQYMQASMNESNALSISSQVWRSAFEETVIHIGILQEMKKAGFVIPPELVDKEVRTLPQFQDNGRFSLTKYRQLDKATQLSLWKDVQDSLITQRYVSDVSDLRQSSKEADFIGAMASKERTFAMAAFPLSSYPEEEITAFADNNRDLFKTVHLSKITINSNEREIRQILRSVEEGSQRFEEAARTHSQDNFAESGGDIGVKMAYEMAEEIPDEAEREAVLNLARGDISPVVKVPSGWAFYRAEETPYPADLNDQETVEKIRTYLTGFRRGIMDDWLIEKAGQFILQAEERGFDTAADELGLVTQNFGPVTLNYGNFTLFKSLSGSTVPELASAPSNENFWRIAFSTPLQTPSAPFMLGNNALVLFPLEENTPEESDIASITSSYTSYWLNNNTDQSIRNRFVQSEKLEDNFWTTYFRYLQPSI
ncbi:MAG: SurA N-terminal domain-containing protein [Spirochaetaceae bacterium]|jgi:parvulin-like peptidyl-prolyl isomerase|nr:SurA N-terminal domain-containing protein [Spirochaetaceae bacterium]